MTTSFAVRCGSRPTLHATLDAFRATTSPSVGVRRSGNDYTFLSAISPNRYLAVDWKLKSFPGPASLHLIDTWGIEQPLLATAFTDASMVRTGTWTVGATQATTLVAGDYLTWTTPASVTTVAFGFQVSTNSGIWAFDIDGDRTLADELPTAQDLVTAGNLDSTALITNGGTLESDQRVYDGYVSGSAQNQIILLASQLSSGVHTVKITLTPYVNPDGSSPRMSHQGGYSGGAATTKDTPGVTMTEIAALYPHPSGQNAESAGHYYPPSPTYSGWIGNNHGYDDEVSFAFTIDGSAVTPTDGTTTWGERLVIARTTQWIHPDIVSPDYLADVVTTYTFDGFGFTVENHITWAYSPFAQIAQTYLSMFSFGASFTRATTLGHGSVESLTENNNATLASRQTPLALAWEEPGHWALGLLLEDLAGVDYWRDDPDPALWVRDRTDPRINKIYATRTNANRANAGDVWTSKARYLVQYLSDPQATFSPLPVFAPSPEDPYADGAEFQPPSVELTPPVFPRGSREQHPIAYALRRHYHPVVTGQTVLKINGAYGTYQTPSQDLIDTATEVYLGGHIYHVNQATALALQDAGYVVGEQTE